MRVAVKPWIKASLILMTSDSPLLVPTGSLPLGQRPKKRPKRAFLLIAKPQRLSRGDVPYGREPGCQILCVARV